jgi:pantoate--beta-alanine ligase
MTVATTVPGLRALLTPVKEVGLVPTMGALHAGHLSLVRAARAECEVVVVSVFVNPAQFRPDEDLERYPRDLSGDLRALAEAGVDHVFAPAPAELYPQGFQTWVDVEGVSHGLEGDARPGHFRGVATVCLKLFNIVRPRRAYFGQKDAQQVAVVERLVRDLDLELEIRVLPTVRDEDGLALSSRNAHLSPADRERALALPRALAAGEDAHRAGGDAATAARAVLSSSPDLAVDYLDVARWNGRLVLAGAIRVGATRLIDNVVLESSADRRSS